MAWRLAFILLLVAPSIWSCKERGGGSSILEDAAIAAPATDITTPDGSRKYPSDAMLKAAIKALGEAQQAKSNNDVRTFRKKIALARLQLRLRPARGPASPPTQARGVINCFLAPVGSGQGVKATLKNAPSDDVGANSDGDGLNVGALNFSFGMSIYQDDGANVIGYIIDENNEAQDEVGGNSCAIPMQPGRFCEDPEAAHDRNDQAVARFYCELH